MSAWAELQLMQVSANCMSPCEDRCPREVEGEQIYDGHPVADDDWVCRAARPQDFNKKAVLKSSFIQATQLKAGSLSVWRVNAPEQLAELSQKLETAYERPENLLAVRARDLRSIKVDGLRAICVINDTRIDSAGGHDVQHAAISACQRFMPWGDDEDSAGLYEQIRSALMLAFRKSGTSLYPHADTD